MYGAIYGDLVGSIYEFDEFKKHDKKRMIKASNEDKLVTDESFYSDDTILTMAIADVLLNNLDYIKTIRDYILLNQFSDRDNYFKYNFSPNTLAWARGKKSGVSTGNGAMMKISPVPLYIKDKEKMVENVLSATTATHNTHEAIKAALCVAHIIYLGKHGYTKEYIKKIVDSKFGYNYDFNLDEIRSESKFNTTCNETIPYCLYALFNTNNFDDAIRLTLSLGKDTDTNCAIVGSMAESLYGVKETIKEEVLSKLPSEYKQLIKGIYRQ